MTRKYTPRYLTKVLLRTELPPLVPFMMKPFPPYCLPTAEVFCPYQHDEKNKRIDSERSREEKYYIF